MFIKERKVLMYITFKPICGFGAYLNPQSLLTFDLSVNSNKQVNNRLNRICMVAKFESTF